MVVRFPSGNTVQFGGAAGGQYGAAAGLAPALATGAADGLDRALGALGDVVTRLEAAIGGLPRKPDGVTVEFGASLHGQCDLWVVSGDGEAEFKVTLSWGKDS